MARAKLPHAFAAAGLARAQELGVPDEVIEAARTRIALAKAVSGTSLARRAHGDIPLCCALRCVPRFPLRPAQSDGPPSERPLSYHESLLENFGILL